MGTFFISRFYNLGLTGEIIATKYSRCQNKVVVLFRTDKYEMLKWIVPFLSFFRRQKVQSHI